MALKKMIFLISNFPSKVIKVTIMNWAKAWNLWVVVLGSFGKIILVYIEQEQQQQSFFKDLWALLAVKNIVFQVTNRRPLLFRYEVL